MAAYVIVGPPETTFLKHVCVLCMWAASTLYEEFALDLTTCEEVITLERQ
jgi:hypothetical protein